MKKTNNNITEMVFILDRSGSMSGLESDTIGGFNSTVEKQKNVDGKSYVTTVLFDNESEMVHDRIPLEQIKPMTRNEYYVRGCTALLDAVGSTINHIETIHKYARPEDVPEHTIFVITTDGYENASHKYDSKTVKSMVKEKTDKFGWEFIFLGANIDSVETAKGLGISADCAADFRPTSAGVSACYSAMSEAIVDRRCNKPRSSRWKSKLN